MLVRRDKTQKVKAYDPFLNTHMGAITHEDKLDNLFLPA